MSEVSERTCTPLRDVLRQPFALTLYGFRQLQERDRIAALRDRIDDVYEATLTALAFNDPPKLKDEREAALSAARESPREQAERASAFPAQADRLIAAIEDGKVLEGDTVTHA